MTDIYTRYAELLVKYSLNIKPRDRFIIQSTYLAEPLLKEIYKVALEADSHPEFRIGLNGTEKIFYDCAGDKQLKYVSPLIEYAFENYEKLLTIISPFDMHELRDVDPAKIQTVRVARTNVTRTIHNRAAAGELDWSLCVFPTEAAAAECGMTLKEYENFVYKACFLYEDDPVAKWNEIKDRQQRIVDFLDSKEKVKYLSKDVDITFSTKGRKWINSCGTRNMPSGEVFTCPVEDSVNGKVRFSFPGFYMGKEIEDISLEVKDGQIIKWNASKGKELLDTILDIPGARRFGEAAVGTNHGIDKFTKNMLFDEKIGGTIHMAIGASLKEAGGKNESAIHWDMLADMRDGGQIFADDELVYENGKFLI
jgi:aminopeptidase